MSALFSPFTDSRKSYFPKCHPYIAGCIVVLLFLFTVYHRKQIESFFTSIFWNDHHGVPYSLPVNNATSTTTATSTMNAEPLTNSTEMNATSQHLLANRGIQQTTGLCNLLTTVAISLILLLIWRNEVKANKNKQEEEDKEERISFDCSR